MGDELREEQMVREANDHMVCIRSTLACAFVALARDFLRNGRRPLTHARCKVLVTPYLKNVSDALRDLEQHGLVLADSARKRASDRIVALDTTVYERADEASDRMVWDGTTCAAVEAAVAEEGALPIAEEAVAPFRRPVMELEESFAFMRERYGNREFFGREFRSDTGMAPGTAYTRIRKLLNDGRLKHTGGIKEYPNNPARYRVAAQPMPTAGPAASAGTCRVDGIKSKAELMAELTAAQARHQRLLDDRKRRSEAVTELAALESRAAELRRLLGATPGPDEAELARMAHDIKETIELIAGYDAIVPRLLRI